MGELEMRLKSLGSMVKTLRKEKGLSQVEIGTAACTSQMTVHRLEAGLGGTRIESLMGIANALGLSLSELFELVDGKSEGKRSHRTPWEEVESCVNQLTASERDWLAKVVTEIVKSPWKAS